MAKWLWGLPLVALLGGAAGAQEGGTITRSLPHQGASRSARFHLGKGCAKEQAVPLLLVLHGEGSDAASMERLSGFSQLADEEGFLAVYPESWTRHWNDGRGAEAYPAPTSEVDDVAFLREVIGLARKEYKVDAVYLCGFSNGAMMALRLAIEDGQEIAAVAAVSGLLPVWARTVALQRPLSLLLVQGTKDPVVPDGGGAVRFLGGRARGEVLSASETVEYWSRAVGAPAAAGELAMDDADKGDGCQPFRQIRVGPGAEVVRIRIEGGGHGWPGGPQPLPASLIGPVCQDFQGAREVWRFFRSHPPR